MANKMATSSHSNGRPPLMAKTATHLHHQSQQNSFVFGSSTPRELSHITHPKVTKRERLIDTKLKPKRNAGERDIVYYMRQARSRDSRDRERKGGISRNYAFGSSTPRSLSHMSNLSRAQRVYDAKIERKLDHWEAERNAAQNMAGANRSLSTRDSRPDEDALSEPDLVQDRQRDFDLEKPAAMGKGNEWAKKPTKLAHQKEEEEENEERSNELPMDQQDRSKEFGEEMGNGNAELNNRMPDLEEEEERANTVQMEKEREMATGTRKIGGDGHISPVSDF